MFLDAPFSELELYTEYISGKASIDTHQGIKGLQFERVFVIIDDEEARGFAFNYEKLFRVKDKSSDDLAHEKAGSETAIDRIRRLFYVTCSRSKTSLAIVAYSANAGKVEDYAIERGWFEDCEVVELAELNTSSTHA